jgi:hypothetical protein
VRVTSKRWHPTYCVREHCTAYDTGNDWAYHRSGPLVIPAEDDPDAVAIHLHLGADPDGSDPYLRLIKQERPIDVRYWWNPPAPIDDIGMTLVEATHVRCGLTTLLGAARRN